MIWWLLVYVGKYLIPYNLHMLVSIIYDKEELSIN